jgi:hypothetical protein
VQPFYIEKELAALPRPRKHYWWYYSTREANADLRHAPQGVHDLLRAYFYYKSADWKGNQPFALKARTATELAKLPTYYVMDLNQTIAHRTELDWRSFKAKVYPRVYLGRNLDTRK